MKIYCISYLKDGGFYRCHVVMLVFLEDTNHLDNGILHVGFLKVIFDRWTHTAASPGEGEFFFGEKTWRLSPRVCSWQERR